ncbi:MAG TPA: V4R domain-containing protein [Anaerolineales bacterium]|nr:V4R domain-containing protein [Anaerolineales bacterium]
MSDPKFSSRILRRFAETVAVELGADQFNAILTMSKLPAEWARPGTFLKMDSVEAANTYASLQAALRAYYGRGARGVLVRVGQRLWNQLLEDAALGGRAQAELIKRLPINMRRKSTLELLGRVIGNGSGAITVHTLDRDLLLVDHASPSAQNTRGTAPICFVTLGLIRESLAWGTGQEHDVEEISCKATGKNTCEFKIIMAR